MKKMVPVLDIVWALVLYSVLILGILKFFEVHFWLNNWMTENPQRLPFAMALVAVGAIYQSLNLYKRFRD